ncbi:MAG: hypothetical protein ACOCRO_05870 [Halanaerobiales bacterium]
MDMVKLYKQYVWKMKNGVKLYFVPLLNYPYSSSFWACVKYGNTDIPAFDKVKINTKTGDNERIEEIKMHKDMSEYIIKQFFEDRRNREDIILGYKNELV